MDSEVKLYNSRDTSVLLKYINEVAEKYSAAAAENEEKLQRLGLTDKNINDLSTKSGLDKAISEAHKNNASHILMSGYCFIQNANNSVQQAIKEKEMQREIIENILRLQDEIKDLQDFNSSLEEEIDRISKIELQPQDDCLRIINELRNEVQESETNVEELRANTMNDETNWRDIIEGVKEMNAKINKNIAGIDKYTAIITGKYRNLPPDVLLSKYKLSNLKQQRDEIQNKIKELCNEAVFK